MEEAWPGPCGMIREEGGVVNVLWDTLPRLFTALLLHPPPLCLYLSIPTWPLSPPFRWSRAAEVTRSCKI